MFSINSCITACRNGLLTNFLKLFFLNAFYCYLLAPEKILPIPYFQDSANGIILLYTFITKRCITLQWIASLPISKFLKIYKIMTVCIQILWAAFLRFLDPVSDLINQILWCMTWEYAFLSSSFKWLFPKPEVKKHQRKYLERRNFQKGRNFLEGRNCITHLCKPTSGDS